MADLPIRIFVDGTKRPSAEEWASWQLWTPDPETLPRDAASLRPLAAGASGEKQLCAHIDAEEPPCVCDAEGDDLGYWWAEAGCVEEDVEKCRCYTVRTSCVHTIEAAVTEPPA